MSDFENSISNQKKEILQDIFFQLDPVEGVGRTVQTFFLDQFFLAIVEVLWGVIQGAGPCFETIAKRFAVLAVIEGTVRTEDDTGRGIVAGEPPRTPPSEEASQLAVPQRMMISQGPLSG